MYYFGVSVLTTLEVCCYYPHLANKEAGSEKLSELPTATQLVIVRAELQPRPVSLLSRDTSQCISVGKRRSEICLVPPGHPRPGPCTDMRPAHESWSEQNIQKSSAGSSLLNMG